MSANLEQKVSQLEDRVEELEKMMSGATVMTSESDLESFLDMVSPGTHAERATAVGYYLVHEDGWNPFDVEKVENGYEECRTPKPANMSDVFASAEEKGWLMRNGSQGRKQLWTITRDGDKAVESGFEQ